MPFKTVVILCAAYFLASAWSPRLSKSQVKSVINQYDEQRKSAASIGLMVDHFAVDGPENGHKLDSGEPFYAELKNLLLAVANDKTIINENSEDDRLMTLKEVEDYIDLFASYDENRDGVIARADFSILVEEFQRAMDLTEKEEDQKLTLKNIKNVDATFKDEIKLEEFLEIMWSYETDIRKQMIQTRH